MRNFYLLFAAFFLVEAIVHIVNGDLFAARFDAIVGMLELILFKLEKEV